MALLYSIAVDPCVLSCGQKGSLARRLTSMPKLSGKNAQATKSQENP